MSDYKLKVRPEKAAVVEAMKEKLGSQGVLLLSFNKLTVKDATALRRKFREHGVEYKVIKNTLTRIAADELGFNGLDDLLTGANGLATCKDDPVAPAAALKEFLKDNKTEAIQVKAGILDGQIIGIDEIKALADLPSRDQLLGMVASALQAPITGLARALNGNILKLAYALNAVREQKESA
jgi:large subunit ribosomal protein L10